MIVMELGAAMVGLLEIDTGSVFLVTALGHLPQAKVALKQLRAWIWCTTLPSTMHQTQSIQPYTQ
jgi:hypothetical protein